MTDLVLVALLKARNQIARPGYFYKLNYYKYSNDKTSGENLISGEFDHPCCIYGAVGFAVNQHPLEFGKSTLGREVINSLTKYIPSYMPTPKRNWLGLTEFGIRSTTTQADVVDLFNRAISARMQR